MLKTLRQIRDVNVEREATTKKVSSNYVEKTKDHEEVDTIMLEDTFVTCRDSGRDDNNNYT